ncbi:MAG: site-2 protease family protein [Patescibacteria group bacterium]
MSIILFLIILLVLIVAHEFGHFIAAKKAGVRVDEFAIGFPPKIFSWTRDETRYSINLLPFGGFVKIFGEDPNDESLIGADRARSLTAKPRLVQAWVVLAGVLFNFILAWVLFSIGFLIGMPMPIDGAPKGARFSGAALTITQVLPGSPAEKAGLKPGDKIKELGTIDKKVNPLTAESVREFISSHGNQKLAVVYEEGKGGKGETKGAILTAISGIVKEKPAIGVSFEIIGEATFPLHLAVWEGGRQTVVLTSRTVEALYDLGKKAVVGEAKITSLTGPVGIVGLVGTASQFGFAYLISFIALISVNLAVLNLLPFPALDGGRAFFILVESIIRRPISYKITNAINAVGFVLLIILMIVVTYHDIVRLIVK